MSEQLDSAYDLIKQGQQQEAIDLLEPLIRADRNNEDAWWLLANATEDPSAKRNALNNVLRLTVNDNRKTKAQTLLRRLSDDPFDFDIETASSSPATSSGMRDYKAIDEAKRGKSGLSCGMVALIIVGIVGVCAIVGGIGIYSAASEIFGFFSMPGTYDDMGVIENGFTDTNEVILDAPPPAYIYSGVSGDTITVAVESGAETAPFITIYSVDSGVLVAVSQTQAFSTAASLSLSLPSSGEYLIAIRGATVLGTQLGYGEYTMEFEAR